MLSVSVTVDALPARNGVPDPGCPAATNLLVTRSLGATLAVPAHSTKSLSDMGVPQVQWPVLTMPDLPTNQDACKGAVFTLLYSGTATMDTARPVHTWTELVSSPDPSVLGKAVTFTAVVATSLGAGTVAGLVSFYSGSPGGPHVLLATSILSAGGRATWTASGLSVGSHSLYAVYAGGRRFAASRSPLDPQFVVAPYSGGASTFESSFTASPASSSTAAGRRSHHLPCPETLGWHGPEPWRLIIQARLCRGWKLVAS